jgi:hypothetical protein
MSTQLPVRPVSPLHKLKTKQIANPQLPEIRVAPFSYVTVAFGPPPSPLTQRAAVHHAVHWNKLREMLRPFGYEEVPDSARVLGDGGGSIITFRTRGEPKLPEPVQAWLKAQEPKGAKVATDIARGAARFLGIIATAFGVPQLGLIAGGATVVIDAISESFGLEPDDPQE